MQLWTVKHAYSLIPAMLIALGISILLGYLLRNKDKKIKIIPIQITIAIMVVLEITKQLVNVVQKKWDGYDFPLHYSSLCLYLGTAYAFFTYNKEGKVAKFINSFFNVYLGVMFTFMVVYPEIVYPDYFVDLFFKEFTPFHSIFYHDLCVLVFFMMLCLQMMKVDFKSDVFSSLIGTLGYGIIEAIPANVFKVNFNNLYYSGVPAVNNLRLSWNESMGFFGQLLYIILYMIVMCVFVFISFWVYKFCVFITDKIIDHFHQRKLAKEAE